MAGKRRTPRATDRLGRAGIGPPQTELVTTINNGRCVATDCPFWEEAETALHVVLYAINAGGALGRWCPAPRKSADIHVKPNRSTIPQRLVLEGCTKSRFVQVLGCEEATALRMRRDGQAADPLGAMWRAASRDIAWRLAGVLCLVAAMMAHATAFSLTGHGDKDSHC